jgi:predicted phage-related endonuclease
MTEEVVDRTKFLGGSDVAAVLGISKWRTPAQLAEEKRRPRVEEGKGPKRAVLDRGKRWEPVARAMLIDALTDEGFEVEIAGINQRYTDPEFGFLAAEIDAELFISGNGLERSLVNCEIKTVHPFALKEWKIDEGGGGELPIYYEAQVQHGLMVTNRQITIVGALVGADYIIPMITYRDNGLISAMRPKLVDFWQRYVLGDELPEAINIEDVRRLYKPTLEGIEATDDIFYQYLRLKAIKSEGKAREDEQAAIEFAIGMFMGSHQSLLSRDGKELLTFKEQSGSFIDVSALKESYPKIHKELTRKWTKRILKARGD